MLNSINADNSLSANPGEYAGDPRILNQQGRTNNGAGLTHRPRTRSIASSSSAAIGRAQPEANLFQQASDRLARNAGVIDNGISSPLTARPNFFEQVHKLSFDESLMNSESDKAFHADVINLVNELEYSDLNVLKNNISTAPRLAVDKLKYISGSAPNPAQKYARALLEQHIDKDAYNNQRWWEESVVAKQVASAVGVFAAATTASAAVTFYTNRPINEHDHTGPDLRAGFTLLGAGLTAAACMPVLRKNHWDVIAVRNNNKLLIMNMLLTQRKSGIDELDSIYNDCKKKGVFDDDYEPKEKINRANLDKIRWVFSHYKPSQSYQLFSREISPDDRTKKYIGMLDGARPVKITDDIARLLSDIKVLGLDYVLREGTTHAYGTWPLESRPRGTTNESLMSRSRLATLTRPEFTITSATTSQETRKTGKVGIGAFSPFDRARQSEREGDSDLEVADV